MHILSTAGTKYLSQTTAKAKNKYKLAITCKTTAPFCLSNSVKKSFGKSSIAGWVQFIPIKIKRNILLVRTNVTGFKFRSDRIQTDIHSFSDSDSGR